MLKLLGHFPKEPFAVACSGGVDSMVLVDLLLRFPKYSFKLLYFNHGTTHADDAEMFLKAFAQHNKLKITCGRLSKPVPSTGSKEDFWRNQRYEFFNQFDEQIATAHNLTDCVETWIFSSLRGQSKLIPYRRNNVFRPFLMVSKSEIESWAGTKFVPFIQDSSNFDTAFTRNLIRHDLMPHAIKVNPGIESMIRRMILKRGF